MELQRALSFRCRTVPHDLVCDLDAISRLGHTLRRLVRRSLALFRRHTDFPSEGTAAPGWLPGIGWSDHWAFWQHGYPAIMVTDTALFRYAPYHTAADTPDRVDYDRMARVVLGLARVVTELAGVLRP